MNKEIKQRLGWVELYFETQDAGLVCRRCGVSRPTLRKWLRRYEREGFDGLQDRSRRPHNSPKKKTGKQEEAWILNLRKHRKLGARRIQNELLREHGCRLALGTIHKILTRNKVSPLKRHRKKADYIRYQRPIPGDRVQMDTCKIAPGIYQYTAVDDCSRYRVLGVFSRRAAANTLMFLDQVVEEMPFPIQRIQTDRGREFFAVSVQEKMMEHGIKFRPIKPGSPHLNGKVERSQRTDKEEFYATANLDLDDLQHTLPEWQHYYNWQRSHGSLKGKTPIEQVCQLQSATPIREEALKDYRPEEERIQEQNYRLDLELRKLKPCL
ncbi:MAG TPA: IS481 family transposase [Gammaproteobacteria bacterium]